MSETAEAVKEGADITKDVGKLVGSIPTPQTAIAGRIISKVAKLAEKSAKNPKAFQGGAGLDILSPPDQLMSCIRSVVNVLDFEETLASRPEVLEKLKDVPRVRPSKGLEKFEGVPEDLFNLVQDMEVSCEKLVGSDKGFILLSGLSNLRIKHWKKHGGDPKKQLLV